MIAIRDTIPTTAVNVSIEVVSVIDNLMLRKPFISVHVVSTTPLFAYSHYGVTQIYVFAQYI